MKKILGLITKYKVWLLALLRPLGLGGIVCIAFADAAAIPIPIDAIIAFYVWKDVRHFYVYVVLAACGSALGGLVPYGIGRAGGEAFLMKRIDRPKLEKLRGQFERQEFLALMIPSMLPPPTPWKLFVFGAGVFEMRVTKFLLAIFTGRGLRNLVTAWLTIEYGPRIVGILHDLAGRHSKALAAGVAFLIALAIAWLLWMWRGKRKNAS